jgi:hypothetical protein
MPQDATRRPMPSWCSGGTPNFGERPRWLTFDAMRGLLLCRETRAEFPEMLCVVLHASRTRVLSVPGGRVACGSDDCMTSNYGRSGRACATCGERDEPCRLRWRIWVREIESNVLFAHTLSVNGSVNFSVYANGLQETGRLPGEVVTNVFVEDFPRKRSGLSFRRLQFECATKRE